MTYYTIETQATLIGNFKLLNNISDNEKEYVAFPNSYVLETMEKVTGSYENIDNKSETRKMEEFKFVIRNTGNTGNNSNSNNGNIENNNSNTYIMDSNENSYNVSNYHPVYIVKYEERIKDDVFEDFNKDEKWFY